MQRASSWFSEASLISEWTGGLTQLDYLNTRDLSPQGISQIAQCCLALTKKIFSDHHLIYGLTGSRQGINIMMERYLSWKEIFPSNDINFESKFELQRLTDLVRNIPSSVGFNAFSLPATRLGEMGHEAELVLGHLLQTGILWEEIRMKGGAYGVFASQNPLEGVLTLATFRDPQSEESFKAFRKGVEYFHQNSLDQKELSNAILGTVSSDLAPRSPYEKGFLGLQRELLGITDDLRQKKRDQMKTLKPKDISKAAQRILNAWAEGVRFSLLSQSSSDKE